MNTKLTVLTEEQVNELKFKDQAEVYNQFAQQVGLKAVKKFRDKATGIRRILEVQETYIEDCKEFSKVELTYMEEVEAELEENQEEAEENYEEVPYVEPKPAKKAKAVKKTEPGRSTRFDLTQRLNAVKSANEVKQGTIQFSLLKAISELYDPDLDILPTAGEVMEEVIANHVRPRAEVVDEQYVVHNIKWFIKKGSIKVQ